MSEEIVRAIGRIEGRLTGIDRKLDGHTEKLDSIDGRLRNVEQRTAIHGAGAGAMAAVGVGILAEAVRRTLGH